ncbi:hypothetical protein [Acutalibacter caecimuris]|nr:hypothetical protein [Acutalibacter sp. M00118]
MAHHAAGFFSTAIRGDIHHGHAFARVIARRTAGGKYFRGCAPPGRAY